MFRLLTAFPLVRLAPRVKSRPGPVGRDLRYWDAMRPARRPLRQHILSRAPIPTFSLDNARMFDPRGSEATSHSWLTGH